MRLGDPIEPCQLLRSETRCRLDRRKTGDGRDESQSREDETPRDDGHGDQGI